jgi:AbiJ N-terminal domain 4
MLTDIFANRYARVLLWPTFKELERRLLVQSYRILSEDVCPYWRGGNEYPYGKEFWTDIQSRLSREFGLKSLSPLAYAYQRQGAAYPVTGFYSMNQVCETWMLQEFGTHHTADRFVKDRLSLIEIGFRRRADDLATARMRLPTTIAVTKAPSSERTGTRLPGNPRDGLIAAQESNEHKFLLAVEELNVRFRQAECDLNYHNGFIQRSADRLAAEEIETPFWARVADAKWKNVDIDMKEAFDRRDSGDRDPAFGLNEQASLVSVEEQSDSEGDVNHP